MKKFFSLVAVVAIIAVSNCTRIPENNDPILGVWSLSSTIIEVQQSDENREEWIFNDAFLGRFHRYETGEIVLASDFSWEVTDGVYTISYRDSSLEPITVIMNVNGEPEQLELPTGETVAIRE